ncbi:MAG: hypothetical protein ACI9V1_001707 [Spirosomataceae bacterium]|jgi:hypothetical protein
MCRVERPYTTGESRDAHGVNLPGFTTEGYGVLFSMMGGTQQVRVLVKELNIANNKLDAELVVQLMDIFGADEGDWATKFSPRAEQFNWKLSVVDELLSNNAKQSLVAFYALQKQRGYNPFRVINTFKITLDNVSLDAKPD